MRTVAAAIGVIIAIVGLSILVSRFNPRGDFWETVEPPKAQCEAYDPHLFGTLPFLTPEVYSKEALDRLVREPQNTVTNLAYAATGIATTLLCSSVLARSFAAACVFLAFGSGMYHASLLPEWRLIDMMGVYVVLFTLALCGWIDMQSTRLTRRPAILLAGGCWVLAIWCAIHRNDFRWWGFKPLDSTTVVLALIGLNSVLVLRKFIRFESRKLFPHWAMLVGVVILGPLAGAGGQGDRFRGFWADPQAAIQGHSVWHVAGAVALLLTFALFYLPRDNGAPVRSRLSRERHIDVETVA